ncbi:MAG: glycerol dehydrogenase, partial [Lachnospiraceae bacterium]|nr:glycerol dehydrogenase [Lachnospiraceae bacterium]
MHKNDSISIPVILKIGNGALDIIGDCLAEEDISNVVVWFGNGLIDLFGTRVMDSMKKAGVNVLEYQELDTV